MSVSWQKDFPPKDGWIRMDATLKAKTPLSEKHIKRLVTFGKPENYEFGTVEQHGAKLVVVYRAIKKESEAAA